MNCKFVQNFFIAFVKECLLFAMKTMGRRMSQRRYCKRVDIGGKAMTTKISQDKGLFFFYSAKRCHGL